MTTANKVTILRILLIPVFIVQVIYYVNTGDEGYRLLAILCFGLAALADGLDGYIARRYHQKSELGALLDPLADKLLLVSGIILLSRDGHPYFERIPLWLTATIISRDVFLLLGLIVINYISGKVKVRPRITGKISTVLQMSVVLWILLQWNKRALEPLCLATGLFTSVAGVFYLFDGIKQLNQSPASAPSELQ